MDLTAAVQIGHSLAGGPNLAAGSEEPEGNQEWKDQPECVKASLLGQRRFLKQSLMDFTAVTQLSKIWLSLQVQACGQLTREAPDQLLAFKNRLKLGLRVDAAHASLETLRRQG